MKNILEIDGHKAVIAYDSDIGMFRGEFTSLNGGADFYGTTIDEFYQTGRTSLRVFLQARKAEGIEPYRIFSGKLNVRLGPALHQEAALRPKPRGSPSTSSW